MVQVRASTAPYDTTSIMATIEHSFRPAPVAPRDAVVNDLSAAVRVGDPAITDRMITDDPGDPRLGVS